jgi:hypothetical protein
VQSESSCRDAEFVGKFRLCKGSRAFANALSINSSVCQLILYGCRIGTDGALYILEMLEKNVSLTEINISNNGIQDTNIVVHAFEKALNINRTILNFGFSGNPAEFVLSRPISSLIKRNEALHQASLYHALCITCISSHSKVVF